MRKLATGSTREGHLAPAFPSLQMSVKSIRENDSRSSLTWYDRLNPVVEAGEKYYTNRPQGFESSKLLLAMHSSALLLVLKAQHINGALLVREKLVVGQDVPLLPSPTKLEE